MFHVWPLVICRRRRKENVNSKKEQHRANERKVRQRGNNESGIGLPHSTTSRTEWHARISRQRRGVRQPYAALTLTSVHWQTASLLTRLQFESPYVLSYIGAGLLLFFAASVGSVF